MSVLPVCVCASHGVHACASCTRVHMCARVCVCMLTSAVWQVPNVSVIQCQQGQRGLVNLEHHRGPRGREAEMDKTCLPQSLERMNAIQEPAVAGMCLPGAGLCLLTRTCKPGRPWAVFGASVSPSIKWDLLALCRQEGTHAGGTTVAGRRVRLLAPLLPCRSCWWQSFPGWNGSQLEDLQFLPGREDAGGGLSRAAVSRLQRRPGDGCSGSGSPPSTPTVWRCPCVPGSGGSGVWGGGLACFRGYLQCLGVPLGAVGRRGQAGVHAAGSVLCSTL